jgi:phosphate-selective porin OprO/OprP
MERPLLDAFAPSRKLGVMAFDTFADKHGTWQIGLFASDSNDDAEEQTSHGGEAVTGRMTYLPYWDEPSDGRYYMHLGGCFSFRLPPQDTARFGYWPGFRPGSFDNIVWPRWADTGTIDVNNVTLLDLEWAWVMGPFHVQAEAAANLIDQIGGPNLAFTAWYVEAGWFLTGESRPYLQETAIFNRVTPFESFFRARTSRGICTGRGAWQVAFRNDQLNLNNQNIQGGRLVDLTFGLNWYLNPYTRVYFNYVHAMLNKGEPGSYGNLFGLRAQFEF